MTRIRVWQLGLGLLCLGIWVLPGMLSADVVLPAAMNVVEGSDLPSPGVFHLAPQTHAEFSDLQWNIGLSTGFRNDSLSWSKAGYIDAYPNIQSELAWTDIVSYQCMLDASVILESHAYFRGTAGFAFIKDGAVRDSDYLGNNRSAEYSRSISETDDDNLLDLSLGGGPTYTFVQGRLRVAPLMGFAIHHQNLRITDGEQVIASSGTPPLGALDEGLNSTFQAKWQGPWLGADLNYSPGRKLFERQMAIALSMEYHFAVSYSATANWNLRSDLDHPVSFRHKSQGSGWLIRGQWSLAWTRRLNIHLGLIYQYWTTRSGTIRMYYSDDAVLSSPLNEVAWQSASVFAGVVFNL